MDLLKYPYSAAGKKRRGAGKVAFLAYKPDIEAAINKGHCLRGIWHALADNTHFPIRYNQFATYVRKYISTPGEGR